MDLDSKLRFPQKVATTAMRPDQILFPRENKQISLTELTVHWETRTDGAYERKKTKYNDMCNQCRENGWKANCLSVEGTRGFASRSVTSALRELEFSSTEQNKAVKGLEKSV